MQFFPPPQTLVVILSTICNSSQHTHTHTHTAYTEVTRELVADLGENKQCPVTTEVTRELAADLWENKQCPDTTEVTRELVADLWENKQCPVTTINSVNFINLNHLYELLHLAYLNTGSQIFITVSCNECEWLSRVQHSAQQITGYFGDQQTKVMKCRSNQIYLQHSITYLYISLSPGRKPSFTQWRRPSVCLSVVNMYW